MKNLNISFNDNDIKYEEYYFNGISAPKDIEFNNISTNSVKISWKIDEINLLNIDNKNIKYKVEIRKEKENDKFISVYEDINKYCEIKNLEEDTNYQVRICSLYNNIESNYSQIYKVKTDINSNILNNIERKKEYINKILEWSGFKSMKLLYRGSRDGMTSQDFHNKCDNKGKTISLFLNDKGNIFGGYSSIPWESNGRDKIANDCFLFSLTNMYNLEPTKFPYEKGRSVFHDSGNGPSFGSGRDLGFDKDFKVDNKCWSYFPNSYKDILGKGNSMFTGDNNKGKGTFFLKELEIFELFD